MNDSERTDEPAHSWQRHDGSAIVPDRTDEPAHDTEHEQSVEPRDVPERPDESEHLSDDSADRPLVRTSPPDETPAIPTPDETSATDKDSALPAELMNGPDVERFRERLRELQADFVDDPEQAVRDAQRLLGEAMEALSEAVAEHKRALDDESPGGDTEELRVALRRYRSALDRLLAV